MYDFRPGHPKWEQIADEIHRRIDVGIYPPGALISEVQVENEFSVARGTVRKAVAELRARGLVFTTHGMGSFVLPEEDRRPEE